MCPSLKIAGTDQRCTHTHAGGRLWQPTMSRFSPGWTQRCPAQVWERMVCGVSPAQLPTLAGGPGVCKSNMPPQTILGNLPCLVDREGVPSQADAALLVPCQVQVVLGVHNCQSFLRTQWQYEADTFPTTRVCRMPACNGSRRAQPPLGADQLQRAAKFPTHHIPMRS